MRVLLIEDDSATAQSIELMLKSENFNVYTTDLGEEGIDLGKLYDYDIILLDLNMPKKGGAEVLAVLKTDPELRDIPVFVLTTSRAEEDKDRVYDMGGSSYINKPVTFETFLEMVGSVTGYRLQIVAGN